MQHATVLDAGARTYTNAVHVATDHGQRPDRAVFTDFDVADDHRRAVDKRAFAKAWGLILVLANGHDNFSLCRR
ncbi:hypothetical protein D3C81_1991830 [compost metagenome]